VRRLAAAAALAVLAVGCGSTESAGPTRQAYLKEASATCQRYGKELDAVRPPTDLAIVGEVAGSVREALPILRREVAEIRAIRRPDTLQPQLTRFFTLANGSVKALAETLAAANRREIGPMSDAFVRFTSLRDEAKRLARSIGFRCD
jgi:hypothetical protein